MESKQPPPYFSPPLGPPPGQGMPVAQPNPVYVVNSAPAQTIIVTQPLPTAPLDPRNVKNLQRGFDNLRVWSNGLCDCFGDCGTCVAAWFCPCIVYSLNKTRLDHLERQNYPHPSGGEACTSDCCIHAFLITLGFPWVIQMATRGNIRNRYRIRGSTCGDCCAAYWCGPCELTQESMEIELEESALRGEVIRV